MTSKMEFHYEIVGRVISKLFNEGLSRVELDSETASEYLGLDNSEGKNFKQDIVDVIFWMISEGLIRTSNTYETLDGSASFINVQLTSKCISIIRVNSTEQIGVKNIEHLLSKSEETPPSISNYIKVGSFVGSILGGFTKSIS
ncbi:hypothetical protein [Stappia stellulata]|uniref:hypothetical protein n=1 Tax=Stappia stellulata TaxID=71235 RepID=UPI0012EB8E75|nr:hypothetical protein [Stappia stellulata]